MMTKKLLFFAFIFFETLYYSQNSVKSFQDKIDFNLLNELVKMSNDSVYVSNLNSTKKLFYFSDSKTNNKIFPNEYEMAHPFVGESAIVKFNGNWGLINRLGKFIYYSETNNTVKLSSYERYAIFNNGVQEIFNLRNGEKQSGFIYCAEPASPDFFIVKTKSNKFQLVKTKDKKSVFKDEMDSIIFRNYPIYDSVDNLIIIKKKINMG